MTVPTIQEQRARILEQMATIDQMVRGHVSTQTYRIQRRGRTVVQGPYYVLQRHQDGRNQCQRLSHNEAEVIGGQVLAYKRYMDLVERYAVLSEQSAWGAQSDAVKKKFRRFWGSTSPKRPPS